MTDRSWIEIDLDAYAHNLRQLRSRLRSDQSVMQIVKADAYGHGAWEIAQRAQEEGVDWLGVANAEEGAILRYRGVQTPILALSPSLASEIDLLRQYNITPTVSDLDFARAWSAACTSAPRPVHVNVDTGMGRSGVALSNAATFLEQLWALPGLLVEGVFSHYSSAENDPAHTQTQRERFERFIAALPTQPRWVHIANSPGAVTQPDSATNLVRLGLLSYGVYPDATLRELVDLRPVMTFKAAVSMVRSIRAGESIGYNRTYIALRDHAYAILPVGYADGYDFLLSNRGQVLLGGELRPVLGKVSMDMIAVGLPADTTVRPGDPAALLGVGDDAIRAESLTSLYGGNPYELLCQLGRRAKRHYRREGEIVASAPLARREFHAPDFSDNSLSRIIEASISQRLQGGEIAGLLYEQFLKRFFSDHDQDVHYRRDFRHTLAFSLDDAQPDHWRVDAALSFTKQLQAEYFVVACANNAEQLERYFQRRDCEYRWQLDASFELDAHWFEVTSVEIDGEALDVSSHIADGCVEIRCSSPRLAKLVGQEVRFRIDTRTWYPRWQHQLSVFITEPTQGVDIAFRYPPGVLDNVQATAIFAGRTRFPQVLDHSSAREVRTPRDQWVFPNSGVVFSY